jgi:hypothetical protein
MAAFLTGDFISEDAVRGALGRRRDATQEPGADGARDASDPTAVQSPSRRASRAAPLRRWSVAQLIARAFASPIDGMSY